MKRYLLLFIILLLIPCLVKTEEEKKDDSKKKVTIKFATIAPKNTTWHNYLEQLNTIIKEKTEGSVEFKIYGGGVQGEEKDVLKKIRADQLHAGAFTAFSVNDINPEIRILELPMLFQNDAELDCIIDLYYERFREGFAKKEYILLGIIDTGAVYLFSNKLVRKVEELAGLKALSLEDEPISAAVAKGYNIITVPLSLTDIRTALQTGMIDTCFAPPLAAVAMQWTSKVKYMMFPHANHAIALSLIKKSKWDEIPPQYQKLILDLGKEYSYKITLQTRKENEQTIEELKKTGIEIVQADEEEIKKFIDVSKKVWAELSGKLYPKEFLDDLLTTKEKCYKK